MIPDKVRGTMASIIGASGGRPLIGPAKGRVAPTMFNHLYPLIIQLPLSVNELESLVPLSIFFEGEKAWLGCGDGDAICESTGRDLSDPQRNQKRFRKERRKAFGPARSHGKTTALWFREARRCPHTPAGAVKYGIPLAF